MTINPNKATNYFLFLLACATSLFCSQATSSPLGKWTLMVYMEAGNDLEVFAPRNIRQMQQVGSNENISILVQHNTFEKDQYHSTTYLIEKGDKKILKQHNSSTHTGEKNLVEFCCDCIEKYPAEHYALVFWNHGTGIIEPVCRTSLSSEDLFSLQDVPELFEKDNKGFMPFQSNKATSQRPAYKGICFDDESGKFLSEKHVCRALKTICSTALNNKKFDLIGFDACLMSMIEVALALEPYADLMVASQDVERGTGWNYQYVLSPFLSNRMRPSDLGKHIVESYHKAYYKIPDFTLSCVLLEAVQPLVETASKIALLLQKVLLTTDNKKLKLAVKISRNKHLCTYFDEPEFVDLYHFYKNLQEHFEMVTPCPFVQELVENLTQARRLIEQAVHANTVGSAYPHAKGLSIYFPERTIHSSYRRCCFAARTHWHIFLKTYLSAYKK